MDQAFSGKELFAPALFFHLEYWLEDVLPRLNTTLSEFEANCENDVENGEVVKFENSGPLKNLFSYCTKPRSILLQSSCYLSNSVALLLSPLWCGFYKLKLTDANEEKMSR